MGLVRVLNSIMLLDIGNSRYSTYRRQRAPPYVARKRELESMIAKSIGKALTTSIQPSTSFPAAIVSNPPEKDMSPMTSLHCYQHENRLGYKRIVHTLPKEKSNATGRWVHSACGSEFQGVEWFVSGREFSQVYTRPNIASYTRAEVR